MEKMPAAVINGLIPCHMSLHVQVDAAGRSTPLYVTNQYSSDRQLASRRRSVVVYLQSAANSLPPKTGYNAPWITPYEGGTP